MNGLRIANVALAVHQSKWPISTMLKLRVITALILAPSAVAAILFLGNSHFAMMMGLVITLAAWEWANISGIQSAASKTAYALLNGLLMVLLYSLGNEYIYFATTLAAVVFWLFALALIVAYQKSSKGEFRLPVHALYLGPPVLVPAWTSLVMLHAHEPGGARLVLLLMVLVWIADIAAYFSGKRWGRTKLCDRVSPGKSREGVYGALLGVVIAAIVAALGNKLAPVDSLVLVAICLLSVIASIVGDLFESLVKRIGNVKDSGNILPGHGGILDRIDSLTAALPVFVALLWVWERLI